MMSPVFFFQQWQRLVVKFGERNMDPELKKLVSEEIQEMSEAGLKRAVDVWIGSRTHNKPPLLSEFREARLKDQKIKFENEVKGAAIALRRAPEEMRKHMRDVLAKEFGAVERLTDAVEIARIRNKTRGDNE